MMATLNRPTRAVSCRAQAQQQAPKAPAASGRRALVLGAGVAALAALVSSTAKPAFAALEDDLLAKTTANKALNDKKRLATSYANLARTRTVADGTCSFPSNFFGCEQAAGGLTKGVKFISDDRELECEGKEAGKCASRPTFK